MKKCYDSSFEFISLLSTTLLYTAITQEYIHTFVFSAQFCLLKSVTPETFKM